MMLRSKFLFAIMLAFSISQFYSPVNGQQGYTGNRPVYIVPNFHPASCGWLTNWSTERNYCANSYLDHLDRVRDDASYKFVLSECNNMIAIRNFAPDRFEELKMRIKEGRVEIPNGFFLESTASLSGGEALVKMGVEGLRWQEKIMGVKPRFAWIIDLCGTHEQMPQISKGLGLEGMIYTRENRTGKTVFRSFSPDGSSILTFVPGHYSDFGHVFHETGPLDSKKIGELVKNLSGKIEKTPGNLPLLVLGGYGDYNLAPVAKNNPSAFLEQWKALYPGSKIYFSTFSEYFDAVRQVVNDSKTELPELRGGTPYTFDAFWIENPRVKTLYRKNEHSLQAAEMISSFSSIRTGSAYPAQDLYHSWLLMLLNMDRNTLWGSAGGMVFEHPSSWDAKDRFEWVETKTGGILSDGIQTIFGDGSSAGLFNPANWVRTDPLRLKLPEGTSPHGILSEQAPDGTIFCYASVPSAGLMGMKLDKVPASLPEEIPLPDIINTKFYQVKIDPSTGAIISLKLKSSGKEMLGGPANVLVADKRSGRGDPGDFVDRRAKRQNLGSSKDFKPVITVSKGPLAYTVTVKSPFYGGSSSVRIMRFFTDHPRIEFETELTDIPDLTVVMAEFPLVEKPVDVRRGIPYGFSHGAWGQPDPALHDSTEGIKPVVRWSDYTLPGGGGLAIIDRGLTGREINGNTPVIYLYNATEKYYGYPNPWLSGKGRHRFEYAILPHPEGWESAGIPQKAWEYNCPVYLAPGCNDKLKSSFIKTSGNVIIEAFRREGNEIELRFAECLGKAGTAKISINLPHLSASVTDLRGQNPEPLKGKGNYLISLDPQEIVTMRLVTGSSVGNIEPLVDWNHLVPDNKREMLNRYQPDKKGHPPRGN